jgi:Copper type II ascorbate-dependent monooxygenase, C-terminal domain
MNLALACGSTERSYERGTQAAADVFPTAGSPASGQTAPVTGVGGPTPGAAGTGIAGEAAPAGQAPSANVPCEVATIISQHCATCHGAMPSFNAPMPLVKAEDFNAPAPSAASEPVRAVASRRIAAEGAVRMPPPGTLAALDATDQATLTAWLDAGATAVEAGCVISANVSESGAGGPSAPPLTPGTTLAPYAGWDDGVECYRFVAFQPTGATDGAPFAVGVSADRYVGFGYKTPWQGTRYVRAFRSIIDNAPVLHHWILYEELGAVPGTAVEIVGAHPVGQMLQAWAPGGSDVYFTPDVGVRMSSEVNYLLEVHYNSSDLATVDASGVEVCVTERPPENEAMIAWLGTDAIAGVSAAGTCLPRATEPIHIISAMPHMHLKGTRMKVTVNRAGAGSEVVHDEAFSFQNQRFYTEDITINPGDSIATACTYSAPALFGRGTNDEMCYWFALAYPAGALSDGLPIGAITHGANACLGL